MEQNSKIEENLEKFLKQKKLKFVEKISKGYSSEVYLVENGKGERFALKIEKEKSPRDEMAEKEVSNLRLANSVGVGPKLVGWDFSKRIILMEYIEGKTFWEWLVEGEIGGGELHKFLDKLLEQAKRLDEIGLDHGQLAGRGANILVREGEPVIIDFEKASQKRKVHNVTQLEAMLYKNPHGVIREKVEEVLGKK